MAAPSSMIGSCKTACMLCRQGLRFQPFIISRLPCHGSAASDPGIAPPCSQRSLPCPRRRNRAEPKSPWAGCTPPTSSPPRPNSNTCRARRARNRLCRPLQRRQVHLHQHPDAAEPPGLCLQDAGPHPEHQPVFARQAGRDRRRAGRPARLRLRRRAQGSQAAAGSR